VKLFQKSSEKKEKDLNDNNKTIQVNGRTKKKNNLLPGLNSANKSNKNHNNQKIFLNKHIVIESKNKSIRGDSGKNNNSAISGNNDDNKNNYQTKNKLREIKNNNNKNNFQKIQNETKNPAKFYFLRNVFNNNDF
jgi:hypothetical protein